MGKYRYIKKKDEPDSDIFINLEGFEISIKKWRLFFLPLPPEVEHNGNDDHNSYHGQVL